MAVKHIKAAVVPVVLVAAIAGAAGYRAQDSGSGKRLDEERLQGIAER